MIPTRVIASHIQAHLEKHDEHYLFVLAEKAQLDPRTIENYVSGERATCFFDNADRLLCAMGAPDLWRTDELSEYYYGVNLAMCQCACPGCLVTFKAIEAPLHCIVPGCDADHLSRGLCAKHRVYALYQGRRIAKARGVTDEHRFALRLLALHFPKIGKNGPTTKYCSKSCRESHERMMNGETTRRIKTRGDRCRNGHLRTPENTIIRKGGKQQCRICYNAASKRGYHRRKKGAA